ncbi:hypothetical protein C8Q76DRAFT_483722 [Earliella scabrosa]|nr:hypothetical protein C8Q76DRAFT_483722 [Earliella scabrosa]
MGYKGVDCIWTLGRFRELPRPSDAAEANGTRTGMDKTRRLPSAHQCQCKCICRSPPAPKEISERASTGRKARSRRRPMLGGDSSATPAHHTTRQNRTRTGLPDGFHAHMYIHGKSSSERRAPFILHT